MTNTTHSPARRGAARTAISAAVALACAAAVHAQAPAPAPAAATAPATIAFDIAPGDLQHALDAFAAQSGTQLLYKVDDLRGRASAGLKDTLTPDEALRRLLQGTPLAVRRDASGAVVVFLPPAATKAEAQEKAPQQLQSIVVTASRRREPVREVPMQVDVLGAEKLAEGGAHGLRDYLSNEAGVDLRGMGGPGMGTVSMRGVTTGAQTIATVGMYVDDVAVGSSSPFSNGPQAALDMSLLDLKNIEVLRGPQGTLYGAGAMGGLLKYVTHDPDTYAFSGTATVAAAAVRRGSTDATINAVLNVPLKEDVAGMRVSAFSDHQGGTVDAVGPAAREDVNRGDTTGARVAVLFEPSRKVRLRLSATTQKIARDGLDYVDMDPATRKPVEGAFERSIRVAEPFTVTNTLLAADLELDLGWAQLNSITAHQRNRTHQVVDLSSAYVPLLGNFGFDLASAAAELDFGVDKTTQEFRLTSKPDAQLEWLAGLYYDRESAHNDQAIEAVNTAGGPPPDLLQLSIPSHYREVAGYGDITWKFADGWALTGGLRYARNSQQYGQAGSGLLLGTPPLDASSSDSSTTYLVTLKRALDDHSDAYLRAASGYRPGGPNAVINDPSTGKPVAPTTFQPDTLDSVELGYKTDLAEPHVSLQAAVFDIRWKNLQQYFNANGLSIVVNAGAARSQGAELSATWRPDAHWRVSGNAAFIDARLSEDAPGLVATAGMPLPSTPRWSGAFNATYLFRFAGHEASLGLTQRVVGMRHAGYAGSPSTPDYRLAGYGLTDLQAGWDWGRVRFGAYVRNLFDAQAQLASQSIVQALGGPAWVTMAQPRTVGATVSAEF